MRLFIPFLTLSLLASVSHGQAQDAASSCGDNVLVERGDTLSSIAERCNLSEKRILTANPDLDGSGDLVVGQMISTGSGASQTGQRLWGDLKNAAGQTSEALQGVASGLNSTAQDVLDKNPDLRSRVDSLGAKLGITDDPSSSEATVQVSKTGSANITVAATGLPSDQAVQINMGRMGAASESVAQERTSADGSLQASVGIPDWLPKDKQAVVTITGPNQTILARSAGFMPD